MSSQQQFQSIDDFIACVIGMGFSLEDAQQAVSIGKLNMEDAIEWILAGKPQPQTRAPAASTLRLHPSHDELSTAPIRSNPFSNPQPISLAPGPAAAPAGADANQPLEENVISRTHMNNEQRRIKERFEEKQRTEAQRLAKLEKVAQKKAKEQVLKQIQDDRETQRLRRSAAPGSAEAVSTSPGSASPRAKEPRTETTALPPASKANKCLLQVRLPDGRAIRETFQADDILRHVWDVITSKVRVDKDMIFMQPFPRQDFTEIHMTQTLTELGLTPSGSLVLKKQEKQATPAPMPHEAMEASAGPPNTASLAAGVNRVLSETHVGSSAADGALAVCPPAVAPQPPLHNVVQLEEGGVQGGGEPPVEGQAVEGTNTS